MLTDGKKMAIGQLTVVAVIVLLTCEHSEAGSVAYKAVCSTTSDCVADKGLTCFKPYKECSKGYCLCNADPSGSIWDDTKGECPTITSHGADCSAATTKCNDNVGLKCDTASTNKCVCKSGTFPSVKCSGGDNVAIAGDCSGAGKTCVATDGPSSCQTNVCACTGNSKNVMVAATCASRLVYDKDLTCGDIQKDDLSTGTDMVCAANVKFPVNSGTLEDVPTAMACTSSKCACASNDQYVRLANNFGFCKASSGSTTSGEVCTANTDCAAQMVCGKCPADTGTDKKCYVPGGKRDDLCSSDADCDDSTGLVCRSKYVGCQQKNVCGCKDGYTYEANTDTCQSIMASHAEPCGACKGVTGLECVNKECACKGKGEWDTDICKKGTANDATKILTHGTKCTNSDICVAKDGEIECADVTGTKRCQCKVDSIYSSSSGACVKKTRVVSKGAACIGVEANKAGIASAGRTGGLCATSEQTVCSDAGVCDCPTAKAEWIQISHNQHVCKDTGSVAADTICGTNDDCIKDYFCGTCADGSKKCVAAYDPPTTTTSTTTTTTSTTPAPAGSEGLKASLSLIGIVAALSLLG